MADWTWNWEDMFGDKLVLSKRFTTHNGTDGAQTPVEQQAASRATRTHVQRDVAAEEFRDWRLELVATYDLTVHPRKFTIEQILAHSPADYDKDYKQMSAEEAVSLRKEDTGNTVRFCTTRKSAHGGFRHWFDKL